MLCAKVSLRVQVPLCLEADSMDAHTSRACDQRLQLEKRSSPALVCRP